MKTPVTGLRSSRCLRHSSQSVHDGRCAIDVIDDGPGLSEEDAERLFSKFEGGSGRTRGSGLGLYISRHLMEAQDGTLALVPDAARTTFRADISLARHPEDEPAPSEPPIVTEPTSADVSSDDTDVAPRL